MTSQGLPLQTCQPLIQEIAFRTSARTVPKALIQARPAFFKQGKNTETQEVAIESLVRIARIINP